MWDCFVSRKASFLAMTDEEDVAFLFALTVERSGKWNAAAFLSFGPDLWPFTNASGDYAPVSFAAFAAAYKTLTEKLQPMVYELGFLKAWTAPISGQRTGVSVLLSFIAPISAPFSTIGDRISAVSNAISAISTVISTSSNIISTVEMTLLRAEMTLLEVEMSVLPAEMAMPAPEKASPYMETRVPVMPTR